MIDDHGLGALISLLQSRGYATRGPVLRDQAIVHGDIGEVGDLPIGCHDTQAPGSYRVERGDDREFFGWAVGPQSLKGDFFSARATVWHATSGPDGPEGLVSERAAAPPIAFVGARPCELAAAAVLDRVLLGGSVRDPDYAAKRAEAFIVVAECGKPSANCFCSAMGTGPSVETGSDLAITELAPSGVESHRRTGDVPARFLVRANSDAGQSILAELGGQAVEESDWSARDAVLAHAMSVMGDRLNTDDLPALLARNHDHPRWAEVAQRCLACGNCTMVCPTCFCSDFDDVSDLAGGVARSRRWSSCFELSHSFIHGGAVRQSVTSRYRQWATHKLSTWHDQFGTSGCVGCGRCITWCPVGIDITEEAGAIRSRDGEKTGSSPAGEGAR